MTKSRKPISVAVDCVVFGLEFNGPECLLNVLLIDRGIAPFKGQQALPGGFMEANETPEDAALRELQEETGLQDIFFEQVGAFGEVRRDPRGRVLSIAFIALTRSDKCRPMGGSDAASASWIPLFDARFPRKTPRSPPHRLAFDHSNILLAALHKLRVMVCRTPVVFELLPTKFGLSQVRCVYQEILGVHIDQSNFRKKVLATGVLKKAGHQEGVPHRQGVLYVFDKRKCRALAREGLPFAIRFEAT